MNIIARRIAATIENISEIIPETVGTTVVILPHTILKVVWQIYYYYYNIKWIMLEYSSTLL
jgi:hypothetical protein